MEVTYKIRHRIITDFEVPALKLMKAPTTMWKRKIIVMQNEGSKYNGAKDEKGEEREV
jgi:hypothetical protein